MYDGKKVLILFTMQKYSPVVAYGKTPLKLARQRYTMKQNFYFLLKSGSEKIVYKLGETRL